MPHFEKVLERILMVLNHHTTWFISLGWNALLLFFQEFSSIILFMAWFEILTNSREGITISSQSLPVIIKQTYLFLKNLNVQSFSLDWSRWDNFESDPKICKYDENVFLVLSVFLLKTLAWLWNLYLEVDIKVDTEHGVKKVLYAAEKWKISTIQK